MRAILMTQTGTPEESLVLQKIPAPHITDPNHVKIKLHAAGVNPIDTKLRRNGLLYKNALPAILGCDGAGEVVEIGAAVTRMRVGDAVWFCHGGLGGEPGNYAEYTVIDQRWLAKKPETLDFRHAAAAPLVLITAWGALFERGGLQSEQTVLIHAGAGGVGHVAIQLAKLRGARVITTVSHAQKAEFVKVLGADEVLLYPETSWVEEVNDLTGGRGADVVLDTVGPDVFAASIPATAHFGRLVTLLDPGAFPIAEARLRNLLIGFELMLTPMLRHLDTARAQQIAMLEQCAHWIDRGLLKIHVSQVLPLADAAAAHRVLELGHTQGKLVLEIDEAR